MIDKAALVEMQIISESQFFILILVHERYEAVIITYDANFIFQSWVENASLIKQNYFLKIQSHSPALILSSDETVLQKYSG